MEASNVANPGNRVAVLRAQLGVTQKAFARILGVTERTIAHLEASGELTESFSRRMTEAERLCAQLGAVMPRERIGRWLGTPIVAFDRLTPIEVIAAGQRRGPTRMA